MKELTGKDIGDISEIQIASEFVKRGYCVFFPVFNDTRYDLVLKKNGKHYTVQVKTGKNFSQGDRKYVRFRSSSKNSNDERISYKGEIDFFAVFNRDTGKCYIIDIDMISNASHTDAFLRLNEEGMKLRGVICAEDQEFKYVDKIIENYNTNVQEKKSFYKRISSMEEMPNEMRKNIEQEQIIEALSGNLSYEEIKLVNITLKSYVSDFRKVNPKPRIFFRGYFHSEFRDFLIEISELKSKINKKLKQEVLNCNGSNLYQDVYEYFESFYRWNGREPKPLDLYQKFLNIKSNHLRKMLYKIRKQFYFINER